MDSQQTVSQSALRIVLWGLFVGIVFAVFSGLGVESSGQSHAVLKGGPPGVTNESIRPVFSPAFGFLGFLLGAMVGSLIGVLWLRGRVGHASAVVLVTLVGGLIGLACADWFCAESRITVSANSIETVHGASLVVIVTGAALGMLIGALAAWGLSRLSGSAHPGARLSA